MKLLVTVAVLAAVAALCEGRQFTVCGLAHQLRMNGIPYQQLRDWVCLIQNESGMKTDVIGGPNSDGSYDHGLYQINDRYWCSTTSTPGKDCNVTCAQLRADDIAMATECAKIIYNRYGYDAWSGWVDHCKDQRLPSLTHCNLTPII